MPTTPAPLHITITTLLPPTPALAQAYLSFLLNLAALLSSPSSSSSSSVHPIIPRGEVSRKLRAARVDAWKDLAQDQVKAKEESEREEGGGLTVKEKELKEKKEAKRAGLSKDELKKVRLLSTLSLFASLCLCRADDCEGRSRSARRRRRRRSSRCGCSKSERG